MAPIDFGDVGGAIKGAADTAVDGAKGVVETATSGAGGAAKTAAGAVATATSAVNGVKGQFDDAEGMLGMFTKMQDFITKIQEAWDKYRYLIIFIVCFIIFIYVFATLYCCYHFIHDCFRCGCCCISCTYKFEKYLWKHRGPCISCLCKPCRSKESKYSTNENGGEKGRIKKEKQDYHKCSSYCLKIIPKTTKMELEKQHGNLRKGWFDSTYFFARSCGRFELPENPNEKLNYHWYGKENSFQHKYFFRFCVSSSSSKKDEKLDAEYDKLAKKNKFWKKLEKTNAENWKDRVPKSWVYKKGLRI
ncbi:uncharacterized protein L201_002676 [Kwoniella dendrophila CBS 6074]|uniref:Uncharacterized protein n=1 Tax=Kwoniella dendrophila CBS 6074 TaxID=1295534 RepID=A0AAX4JSC4_9TREE